MSTSRTSFVLSRAAVPLVALLHIAPAQAYDEAASSNPIGRIARVVNPKLSELESRLGWLEGRLRYLAAYTPTTLRHGMGWRGGQSNQGTDYATLTVDLGATYPLSDLYVVPSQPQLGNGRRMFPPKLRIETSMTPDFSGARVIYETRDNTHESDEGHPLRVITNDIDARYVRLSILRGHHQGPQSIAAISELMVLSGGEPISIGADVSAEGSLDSADLWAPRFAVDGRMPLGIWEGGQWKNSSGVAVGVEDGTTSVEWLIDLGKEEPVDRVVLFPYKLPEFGETSMLPADFTVTIGDDPSDLAGPGFELSGGETTSPVTAPLRGARGRYLLVRCETPFTIGNLHLHAFSEIEVWSHGRNLAPESHVIQRGPLSSSLADEQLTDGYSHDMKILPLGRWLRQLNERQEITKELAELEPLRDSMEAETEINTTWAASIAIGLTFLIPVAFFERRRLVSRKHLDKLRKRIASDLHDDIGSNLGSISLIARSAKRDLGRGGSDALAEDLAEVEGIARESSLAMRDIVWLLERREDTIGDFVKRMRDTASRLLRDMDYEFTCRSNRTALKMTLDSKRHLFLFYKESLHNILKHANASKVNIRIHDSGTNLVLEVEDDGVGLPADDSGQPVGVRKLTERAAVLEGRLRVESKSGHGTRLRLELRRASLIANKIPS